MRTGDTVFHKPSGEKWTVAWADDRYLIPCGWPETMVAVYDCKLITSCSDAEYRKLLEQVASSGHEMRRSRCFSELEKIREAECLMGWRY